MHRDTEKEPGMFATLIVQLPTEGGYRGGALVVNQETWSCSFNAGFSHIDCFHEKNSTAFHYAAFFADCRHTLERVTAGTRLCLSFNLVRRTNNGGRNLEQLLHSPMFKDVEVVLRPWLEAAEEDDGLKISDKGLKCFPSKLAIPLQHKYTPSNLKFSRLKGEDVTLFHVLANCLDRRLDLHLCLLTKHQVGMPVDRDHVSEVLRVVWSDGHSIARGKRAGGCITMDYVEAECVQTSNWIDVDDHRLPIFPWFLDTKTVVVLGKDKGGLFVNGEDPDELQYEGYTGNEGPTLEYFYYRAMIVAWPKTKTVPTIIAERRPNNYYFARKVPKDAEVLSLLNFVERLLKDKLPCGHLVASQLLAHCELKCEVIWGSKHDQHVKPGCTEKSNCVSSRLLDMCVAAGDLADVLRVLQLYSKIVELQKFDSRGHPSDTIPWSIGVRSKFVAKSIAAAVHAHGWTSCGVAVLRLLQKDRVLEEGEYYGQLALELQQLGHHNEAFVVVDEALNLVTSSMASVQCSSELLKILVKLIMSMSKECRKELGSKLLRWLGPAPEFSWNQPFARLPSHPAVEAFLRGPLESFTYENVDKLPEVRKLAQGFDGRYKKGYCAIGREGVLDSGAYYTITKSRDGFRQCVLKYWERQQEQVRELRHQLQEPGAREKQETTDGAESSDKQTEGVGEREKKRHCPGIPSGSSP